MLSVSDLSKSYDGRRQAVDHISFCVQPGEIFGFLGPNGAGKTTTIKMICGILKIDDGDVWINGVSMRKNPIQAKAKLSYVPDNPEVYVRLKGLEYLNFMADMYGVSAQSRSEKIERYADLFEMFEALSSPISSYSHGMKQKIVIMGALMHDPDLFVLDEPMVGLDPKSAHNLKGLMRSLCKEGKSVFFSTHLLDTAEKFCDRVGIIKQGKLLALDQISNLKHNSKDTSLEEIFLEMTEK